MHRWLAILVVVAAATRLSGQSPPRADATIIFEVASVKPNQSRGCDRDGSLAGGRLVMTCATLRELLVAAYPRQDGRSRFDTELTGGPSWMNADHFDVVVDVDCVAQRGSGQFCGGFKTSAPGHTIAHGVTMSLLAQVLEMPVSRNVVDHTGLQGRFDVELQYTPDRLQLRGPDVPANDSNGVSVFTTLREQLGLKLEPTKAAVDVLVIDHVEKPTPD